MNKVIISLRNISKEYNVKVLNNLNLDINENDYISIIGKSGSGKSTLMNIIGLLENYTAGEYIFMNRYIQNSRDYDQLRLKYIGFIFQSYNLIPTLSGRENILLPLLYSNESLKLKEEYFKSLIDLLDIRHLLDRAVNTLSGGEKQRIAIARALILDPKIIIADEPTGNLDSENKKIIVQLFQQFHKDGKTIILITHDRKMAKYAQKQYELKEGILNELCLNC